MSLNISQYGIPVSRLSLFLQTGLFRTLASVGGKLAGLWNPSHTRTPSRIQWIDATLGEGRASEAIRLVIYTPDPPSTSLPPSRPGVIVFHGGGNICGSSTDDARWATYLVDHLGAVVIGVDYRLAPSYPFPIPVEDCASSILHISNNSHEYGIDRDKLFVSGFSAGGNLAFASYMLLQAKDSDYQINDALRPKIRGLLGFYPVLDYSVSRETKRARSLRPDLTLPLYLANLFDASYIDETVDRFDSRLSPALASTRLISSLPGVHLCLCEFDMLLSEGQAFHDRIRTSGGDCSLRIVKGEQHGWDKGPRSAAKESVDIEYEQAASRISSWLAETLPGPSTS
ncbi:hypothetical protein P7C73_g3981, partial [Tremellales sp. Uapishka_1]